MRNNFWQQLKKPILALAPMADVTDFAMRQMLVKHGKPDVIFTEFVSADGLASEKGRQFLVGELQFAENERPIVAQIFGANPENIKKAANIIAKLGFDGLDINMGCPDKAVIKQGAGAALIKNPTLAREIIRAAKAGAPNLPISVKTRIGFNQNEIQTWLPEILAESPAALTVHLRTKKEMSEVAAHWELMPEIASLAQTAGVVLLGNGDVTSREEALKKAKKYQIDGVMIGRGFFGKPYLLNALQPQVDLKLRLELLWEHTQLFEKHILGKTKNFAVMKKHYKAYLAGFKGARALREKFMQCEDVLSVGKLVAKKLKQKTR